MNRNFLLCLGLGLSLALAQTSDSRFMNVATGTPTGTYSKMFKDMGQVCTNAAYLRERGTAGTLENIELLLSNQVSMAFLQVDALEAKKQIDQDDRVNQIKALIALYPEEIHLVVRANLENVTGNFFTKKRVPVTKLSELAGRVVGAWGGSVITTRVVQAKGGVAFKNILVFQGRTAQADALAALNQGQIDAILSVGGQPITWIKDLPSGQYRLLNVDILDKLPQTLYKPARISYPNLNLDAAQTFSVLSILATRDFRSPDRAKQLVNYKNCVIAKITDLREGEGRHPKWGVVDPAATPPWPVYEPPQ